jgi:hypothetical protein
LRGTIARCSGNTLEFGVRTDPKSARMPKNPFSQFRNLLKDLE